MSTKQSQPRVYSVPGDPIPLARARHGHGKTWDPQKQLKLNWGILLAQQHGSAPLYEGPLHLEVTFYMPIPKTSQKRTLALENTYHSSRCDLDNLCKYLLDVGNTILYKDDSLFASITARKLYSKEPRTEFTITEIKQGIKS